MGEVKIMDMEWEENLALSPHPHYLDLGYAP